MPHPIYTPTQIIVRSIPHIMRSELIFPNLRQSNAASIHSKKSWIFNCSLDSFLFFISVFKCIPLLYYSIFSITSILLYLHSFDHMITHFISLFDSFMAGFCPLLPYPYFLQTFSLSSIIYFLGMGENDKQNVYKHAAVAACVSRYK